MKDIPSLVDWPWNPALQPWQRDIILAMERGDHVLHMGYRGGKTLMAKEAKKRWEARQAQTPLRGFHADVIFIDELEGLKPDSDLDTTSQVH